ncbi:SMR family transporter [Lactobacillus mulieris]|jgi:quaternary ammonium compound-resistance protein qacH|uniref:SMR family transporter n=1 Tax=Lactobacillus mulieris TaxID=2508708 RepID=A0AAP3GXH9_9LACO|nr:MULTISPECIES: SMR family transporter [Lactobacillus]EEX23413.1 putative multidrug transporter EmrE [Lactobacillus jensenii 115-3-CHN]EFH30427.1 multidrug resistance protein, SMR family [Lactobacillus jensenii JV-V16]KAA9243764.1 EamA family transporter [Lactobacillus jensenii]KAA9367199.1 EamA family transporter [Lactobacillus jensenii]KAA9372392.1 EamA family transporter [Lactobacillus jensenii]
MKEYVYLLIAIIGELIGTTLLKASDGFSKLFLGLLALFSYASCYFFFSKCLRTISLGVAYAIWSGVGIVITTVIGIILWKEKTNLITVLAIIMIIIGIILLNLTTTNK